MQTEHIGKFKGTVFVTFTLEVMGSVHLALCAKWSSDKMDLSCNWSTSQVHLEAVTSKRSFG
jgi:hypothetical protein